MYPTIIAYFILPITNIVKYYCYKNCTLLQRYDLYSFYMVNLHSFLLIIYLTVNEITVL